MAGRIEQTELDAIRELHDKVQIRSAHVNVAKAELDLAVTKAFVKHQHSSQTHNVCLSCGAFSFKTTACECNGTPP